MVLARVQTWKVDELEKTISVASRDPAYYGLDEVELSRRRNWTGSSHKQVCIRSYCSNSSVMWWLDMLFLVCFEHEWVTLSSGCMISCCLVQTLRSNILPCSRILQLTMYLNLLHGSSQFMHEHIQVGTVKRAIEKGKSNAATSKYQDTSRTNHYSAQDNDDFISSESDRQLLLMRWV